MKILLISGLAFLLSGCAMPFGLQIVSYIKTAADIGSYVKTDKSLTDHLVSSYNKEDCAFHRVFIGKDICKPVQIADEIDNITDVKVKVLFPAEKPKVKKPSVTINWDVLEDLPTRPSVTINWDVLDNLK